MTREEAREILTHNWTRVDNPNYSESELDEAFFMAIEALSAKPTIPTFAESEEAYKAWTGEEMGRPHGEWIKRGTKITCSHCKSAWSASFDTIIVGMKYCPNCGAKMGGDTK